MRFQSETSLFKFLGVVLFILRRSVVYTLLCQKEKFTKNFIISQLGDGPCLGTWDPNIEKYTWLTYNQVSSTSSS